MGIHLHLQFPDLCLRQPFFHLVRFIQLCNHIPDRMLHLIKSTGNLIEFCKTCLFNIPCLKIPAGNFLSGLGQIFN